MISECLTTRNTKSGHKRGTKTLTTLLTDFGTQDQPGAHTYAYEITVKRFLQKMSWRRGHVGGRMLDKKGRCRTFDMIEQHKSG